MPACKDPENHMLLSQMKALASGWYTAHSLHKILGQRICKTISKYEIQKHISNAEMKEILSTHLRSLTGLLSQT